MKYLFYLLFFIVVIACVAPETVSHLENKYSRAIQLDDYYTAIVYLHELQDLDTDNNTVYKRLANCYYKIKAYESAIKAVDVALKPANKLEQQKLLFIKAKSLVELNNYVDAVAVYTQLMEVEPKRALEYRYEIGVLYKAHGDIGNAILQMEQNVKDPLARLLQREIVLGEGKVELVTYYHASLNFIGAIQIEANDLMAAQKIYQKLFEDSNISFVLARQNYQILLQLIEQNKQPQ
jgi:tetratricopeptide (TPR) repeat protein